MTKKKKSYHTTHTHLPGKYTASLCNSRGVLRVVQKNQSCRNCENIAMRIKRGESRWGWGVGELDRDPHQSPFVPRL